MQRPLLPFMALVATLWCSGAVAQVSARQGEPDARDVKRRFNSPMIVDLPLSITDSSLWGQGQIRASPEVELRQYVCDGVSFVDFATSGRRQRGHLVKVLFDFTLANEPGVDKLASGRFSVVEGDREIGAGVLVQSQVEEGRLATRRVSLTVSEAELMRTPAPTLRILLNVKTDD